MVIGNDFCYEKMTTSHDNKMQWSCITGSVKTTNDWFESTELAYRMFVVKVNMSIVLGYTNVVNIIHIYIMMSFKIGFNIYEDDKCSMLHLVPLTGDNHYLQSTCMSMMCNSLYG